MLFGVGLRGFVMEKRSKMQLVQEGSTGREGARERDGVDLRATKSATRRQA